MHTTHLDGAVLLAVALVASCALCGYAAATPVIQGQVLLGGSGNDHGQDVLPTTDGGYAVIGFTDSSASGDIVGVNHGGEDIWVVKLGPAGYIQAKHLYGGSGDDEGYSIDQTGDGGLIFAGFSESSESDDVTDENHGGKDAWVVKLGPTGATEWNRLLGGSGDEEFHSVRQTADGGYILAGFSDSSESWDVTDTTRGNWDFWVVKLDADGGIEWQKLLGGWSVDRASSVRQTPDGGYIVAGQSSSSRSWDVTGDGNGYADIWLVKLDAAGTIEWNSLFGGSGVDSAYSVEGTRDGDYIVAAISGSSADGDVSDTNHGTDSWDCWVLRVSDGGALEWETLLGGEGFDWALGAVQAPDGGFLVAGSSDSSASGDVAGISNGRDDAWVVKLNEIGTVVQWQQLFGGSESERVRSVRLTADGGYVLAGESSSSESGTITVAGNGGYDYWVVKLAPEGLLVLTVVPGGTGVPTDPGGDGLFDDVNGNGRADFADVVLFFNHL